MAPDMVTIRLSQDIITRNVNFVWKIKSFLIVNLELKKVQDHTPLTDTLQTTYTTSFAVTLPMEPIT